MQKRIAVTENTVIGQTEVVNFLAGNIHNGQIHHAYLLVGPRGVGKRAIVRQTIQALLCPKAKAGRPWGDCSSCRQVAAGSHPDVMTIRRLTDEKTGKEKSVITVEQVRTLREKMSLGSLTGPWTIGVIEGAEELADAGANALLKLLEEPHARAVLFLIAESTDDLPATIASRCHVLRCELVSHQTIYDWLTAQGIGRDQSLQWAAYAAGRPELLRPFMTDPAAWSEHQQTLTDIASWLSQSCSQRFRTLDQWLKNQEIPTTAAPELLSDWSDLARDMLLWRASPHDPPLGIRYLWLKERLKKGTVDAYSADDLRLFIERCQAAGELLAANVAPQLSLEYALLSLPDHSL